MLRATVLISALIGASFATAAPPSGDPAQAGRPLTFLQAAAFQWVNPKAVSMALTAMTAYLARPDLLGVLAVEWYMYLHVVKLADAVETADTLLQQIRIQRQVKQHQLA